MKRYLNYLKLLFAFFLKRVGLLEKILSFRNNLYYFIWQITQEPDILQLENQKKAAKRFEYSPTISIVCPVFNPPLKAFKSAINSVLRQTYSNWELCIADASTNVGIRNYLKKIAYKDTRIRVIFLDRNLGIAQNTNKAIELSSGQYIAFLDHDDELSAFALFEVVKYLQIQKEGDLIYSDEDLITDHFYFNRNISIFRNIQNLLTSNRRFYPIFKPSFSLDTLRSYNYMTHLVVVKKELGEQIAWLREGFEGAQDYDFVLRAVEKSRCIVHIPKILYHWRRVEGSTAKSINLKPYANESGKKALHEHLIREGVPAEISDGYIPTWYKVNYIIPSDISVSIIIPNGNSNEELIRCVGSILFKSSYKNFELIIVDTSTDNNEDTQLVLNKLRCDSRIKILRWDKAFNFHSVNNWAVEFTRGNAICFLNNDTEVISQNWIEQMLSICQRKDVGFVGAKLLYPDKTIQHAGITIGKGGVAGHDFLYYPHDSPGYVGRLVQIRNVAAVTGACMMVKKNVFTSLGGFDENYVLSYGDVDICLRALEKGLWNVWTPYAILYHYESRTRGYEDTAQKKERFEQEKAYFLSKWKKYIANGDPYYNPNLDYRKSDYVIKIF